MIVDSGVRCVTVASIGANLIHNYLIKHHTTYHTRHHISLLTHHHQHHHRHHHPTRITLITNAPSGLQMPLVLTDGVHLETQLAVEEDHGVQVVGERFARVALDQIACTRGSE